jgi:hypothetical protein
MRKVLAYSNEIRCSKKDSETYLLMTTADEGCRGIIEGCRDNLGGCRGIERGVNLSRLLNYMKVTRKKRYFVKVGS